MFEEELYQISKNNFNDESELVQKFCSNLESLDFIAIQNKTEELLSKLQDDKSRTLIESLVNEFGIGSAEGSSLMELAEALLRVPDKYTSYELIRDKLSRRDWLSHVKSENPYIINSAAKGLNLASKIMDKSDHDGMFKKLIRSSSSGIIDKFARNGVAMMGEQFIMGQQLPTALKNAKKKR